jgi:hypothetical protein
MSIRIRASGSSLAGPSSVTFHCPSCNVLLEADAEQMVACPQCNAEMQAPAKAGATVSGVKLPAPAAKNEQKKKLPLVPIAVGVVALLVVVVLVVSLSGRKPAAKKTVKTVATKPVVKPAAPKPVTPPSPPDTPVAIGKWNLSAPATVNTTALSGEITDIAARPDGRLVVAGSLASIEGAPSTGKRHLLLDNQPGAAFGFVAELAANGKTWNWFSAFGGDLFQPQRVALAPDGSVYLGGKHLPRLASVAGKDAGSFTDKEAALIKVSADGSRVEWVRGGGPNQNILTGLAADAEGRIVWSASARGKGMAAYVIRRNADGADSKFPARTTRDWAIDFHMTIPEFLQAGQIGAFYALSKEGEGYDYDGPGPYGPVRYSLHGIRGGGHVLVLPDGDLVASGALQYDFKLAGKWEPGYDIIVARFSPDGVLKWSTNLYQPGDSVHIPDQKDRDLLYNPVNGDLYVLGVQHGSNVYRLKGDLRGDTGNLLIGWVGQIEAATGKLKNGWYWMNSRNTGYDTNGAPTSPPHPQLAGNNPTRLAVDALGRIYLSGDAGAKAFTTPNAHQSWPADQDGGGHGALVVLSPNLDRVLYATVIRDRQANTVALTTQGIFIGGTEGLTNFRFPTAD